MEKQRTACQGSLQGSPEAIGRQLAGMVHGTPMLEACLHGIDPFDDSNIRAARELFDRFCPGLNDEIGAFAEAVGADPRSVTYYAMTYLVPRCSQMLLMPAMTADGHILQARNYEFSDQAESFTLLHTTPQGRYAHLGTDVLLFGREEGMNECGLAVTMSSCGFPVGPMPYMRAPKLKGLQFWAVIRALLENCRDVDDALRYLADMPIAFNINLMVSDKGGHAILVETMDGERAIQHIGDTGRDYMLATNHICIPSFVDREPKVMRHSLRRYEALDTYLRSAKDVTIETLQSVLLTAYPEGPCCHHFTDFFGTTKSIVIDVTAGTLDLCWGGEAANGWRRYRVDTPVEPMALPITMTDIPFLPGMGDFIDR